MTVASAVILVSLIFSILLNIIVAIAMSFDPNAKNSTYRCMVHLALADAATSFSWALQHAGILFSSIGKEPITWAVSTFLVESTNHCAEVFLVLVAFTRWLHFAKPHLNDVIFTKNRFRVIVFISWLSMLALYSPVLFGVSIFDSLPGGAFAYRNTTYGMILSVFDPTVNFGALGLQVVFNIATFSWILALRNKVASPEVSKKRWQEIRLYTQCAIDGMIFLLGTVVYCVYSYWNVYNTALYYVTQVLNILNLCDCALLYLCFNQPLRAAVVKFIKEKLFCKGSAAPVVSLQASYNRQ